MVNVLELTLS